MPLILYLRLDDFFATIEQRLIPSLRGRPVIVGEETVVSCSREARQAGVRLGMSLARARRRCPGATAIAGHDAIYTAIANQVWDCCRDCTTALETYAADAYGDAGGMALVHGPPPALGRHLHRAIAVATGLPVTIGFGRNRLMAWMAAHQVRPGQVGWTRPFDEARLLASFPIAELPGVAPATLALLRDLNLAHLADLRPFSREQLRAISRDDGDLLYERCRGLDAETVDGRAAPHTRQQTLHLDPPLSAPELLRAQLQRLVEESLRPLRERRLQAGRVELTVVYDDGRQAQARRVLATPTAADAVLYPLAEALLDRLTTRRVAVRRLLLCLERLGPGTAEGDLFAAAGVTPPRDVHPALDRLRARYGSNAILTGRRLEALQPHARHPQPGSLP